MAGVTHFERRDKAGRAKKSHPLCPFCGREFRCTPKAIHKAGGPVKYIDSFQEHLTDHLAGRLAEDGAEGMAANAISAMRYFAPMVWDNC